MNIGKKLQEFRIKQGKTQLEIANDLGVTQVTVSRIEKGMEPSTSLLNKIASILGEKIKMSNLDIFKEKEKDWSIAYFVMANQLSGDRVVLNKKGFEKICIAHIDSEGHDSVAIASSSLFEIVFEAIVAALGAVESLTASQLIRALDRASRSLRKQWKVSSSCNVFVLNKNNGGVAFVNAGMPNLYYYSSEDRGLKKIDGTTKLRAIGDVQGNTPIFDTSLILKKGDVLASFSDGFLEFMKRSSGLSFDDYFVSISRSLRGDSEGIASKVLKDLIINENKIASSDDFSFLILGRS